MNLHICTKLPQRASVSAISAGDVNLWGTFLMIRIIFSVAATAAAVATIITGISPIYVSVLITLIFGRRLWRHDALS
jgi:uncharacterized membrane protein YuzA (DUF378 family)